MDQREALFVRHLPDELKALRQWVVWRAELRPGKSKPAKAPYQPRTGHRARTDVPATWGTYPQALARYQYGGWYGLGFVFTASDPYCGIDLDDCHHPQTEEIASWAWEIVEQIDSYTEISPSGRGLHILVKATLPDHAGRKQGAVEVYDAGRYFAVTGQRLAELPATIEECQAEVLALYATLAPTEPTTVPLAAHRCRGAGTSAGCRQWRDVSGALVRPARRLSGCAHRPGGSEPRRFCALPEAFLLDQQRR